ncbi:hypothetical protein LINPERPRIM_LOCUS30341 [Linum perenne]
MVRLMSIMLLQQVVFCGQTMGILLRPIQ